MEVTEKGELIDVSHEDKIRETYRELYLNSPWTGTIEERLQDNYLYCITQDDLSLSPGELIELKKLDKSRKEVFVQTGKAGVMSFVAAGIKAGETEEVISRKIWIEMVIDDVPLYINIKCIKVIRDDKKEN